LNVFPLPPFPPVLFHLLRYLCLAFLSLFFFAHPLALLNPHPPKKKSPKSHNGQASSHAPVSHDSRSLRRVWSLSDKAAIGRRSLFILLIHLSTPSTTFCLHPRGFGWFADDSHACISRLVLVFSRTTVASDTLLSFHASSSHPCLVCILLTHLVDKCSFFLVFTCFSLLTSTQHPLYVLDAHPLPHHIPFAHRIFLISLGP